MRSPRENEAERGRDEDRGKFRGPEAAQPLNSRARDPAPRTMHWKLEYFSIVTSLGQTPPRFDEFFIK